MMLCLFKAEKTLNKQPLAFTPPPPVHKQKTRTDTRSCSPSTLKFSPESGCIPESGDTKRDLSKKSNNKVQSQAIKLHPTDIFIKEKFLWGSTILLGAIRSVCIFIIRISTASYPVANTVLQYLKFFFSDQQQTAPELISVELFKVCLNPD